HVAQTDLHVEELPSLHGRPGLLVAPSEPRLALPVDHPVARQRTIRVRVAGVADRGLELLLAREHVLPGIFGLVDMRISVNRGRHDGSLTQTRRAVDPTAAPARWFGLG